MKHCDQCGCEIPPGEEVHDIVTERFGKGSHDVKRTFCPQCARQRSNLAGFLLKVIGLLVIGMAVLGLLGSLMH
jgi:hypothetical protein